MTSNNVVSDVPMCSHSSVVSGFRVDSNRSGKMQSGRVESRAVLTLVILTG